MWSTRPETPQDVPAIRALITAAFPTPDEATLVDTLRADPHAWIDGLSTIAESPDGTLTAHALITRCHIDDTPALALAPCATLPAHQRRGAGSAAIHACLTAARTHPEPVVIVLGHPDYYPRFGFTPASTFGIHAPFDVPDTAFLALPTNPTHPIPTGTVRYPSAFGI
jgi:putative acetyltransferase